MKLPFILFWISRTGRKIKRLPSVIWANIRYQIWKRKSLPQDEFSTSLDPQGFVYHLSEEKTKEYRAELLRRRRRAHEASL